MTAVDFAAGHKPARTKSLVKGALAGLVAGIAGTAAKVMAEAVVPPWVEGRTPPQVVLAERVAGEPLEPAERKVAFHTLHWGFGVLAGVVYGVMAESDPQITGRRGIAFGLALNRLTQERLLPEAHLVPPVDRQPTQERVSQWVTHVAYGLVTDTVRRGVRAGLD